MNYTIKRQKSIIRFSYLFGGSGLLIGAVIWIPVLSFLWPQYIFVFLLYLLPVLIYYLRFLICRAEGARVDAQWDEFVNKGLAIRFNKNYPDNVSSWLEDNLPSLPESSGPSRWLNRYVFPAVPSVPITLPTPLLAQEFASRLEYSFMAAVAENLSANAKNDNLNLTSFGRIFFKGKRSLLIFRQPIGDEMLIYFFRVEVTGQVVNIYKYHLRFIRRQKSTSQRAQNKNMTDDEVYFIQDSLSLIFVGILFGYLYISLFPFVVFGLFFENPFNWWCFGELGCWGKYDWSDNRIFPNSDSEGWPDWSNLKGEEQYLTKMLENEIPRYVHSGLLSQSHSNSSQTFYPTSTAFNPGGFL